MAHSNLVDRPIGIFDSGRGGLTVLNDLLRCMPKNQDFIYLGDTARVPYGVRSSKTICRYSCEAVQFLLNKSVKAIVIACNSATACAENEIRNLANATHGVEVFGVIEPGVQAVLALDKPQNVMIVGTHATIQSQAYQSRLAQLSPQMKTHAKVCPLFVSLVEEGWIDHKVTKMVVREYLDPIANTDVLLLACTHFPLLKPLIQRMYPKLTIIDSGQETARQVNQTLQTARLMTSKNCSGRLEIYFTDLRDPFTPNLAPFAIARKIDSIQEVELSTINLNAKQ